MSTLASLFASLFLLTTLFGRASPVPLPADASASQHESTSIPASAPSHVHVERRASGNPVLAPATLAGCFDSDLSTIVIALYWSWNSLATAGDLDLIIKNPDGSYLSHKAGFDLNELDPTLYAPVDPNYSGPYTGYARDVPPCTSPLSPFYSLSGVSPAPSSTVLMDPEEDGSSSSSPYAIEYVYLYNVVPDQIYNISVYQSTNTDGFTKDGSAVVKMWYFNGATTTTSTAFVAPSSSSCKGRFWNVFSVSFSKPGSYLTHSLTAINTVTSYPYMFGTSATQDFEIASRTTTGC